MMRWNIYCSYDLLLQANLLFKVAEKEKSEATTRTLDDGETCSDMVLMDPYLLFLCLLFL